LPAGELTGELVFFLCQDRKQLIDLLDCLGNIVVTQECTHFKIFINGHAGKHVAGLRDEGDTLGDAILW
jgi:hypothetical protein